MECQEAKTLIVIHHFHYPEKLLCIMVDFSSISAPGRSAKQALFLTSGEASRYKDRKVNHGLRQVLVLRERDRHQVYV